MPNKVKQRWIARQVKRGNPRFIKYVAEPSVEDVSTVEEAIVEDVSTVEEVVEPVVVESGTVTDVEVVEKKPAKKAKKTKEVE
jgi:hypothetical protein